MGSSVTPKSIRSTLLAGYAQLPELASIVNDDEMLQREINRAKSAVERLLSTRFTVTRMIGWFGPGAKPSPGENEEYESAYDYPGRYPGDGYQKFVTRVRPIKEFFGGQIKLPGVTMHESNLPPAWFRFQEFGEVMMAPALFGAPFVSSGAMQSLIGFSRNRLPQAVTLDYKAGLDDEDFLRFPQIDRLVELKTLQYLLITFSNLLNPEAIANESADGLSQSRSNNFVYKDLYDQLDHEIEAESTAIKSVWDGPEMLVL